MFKINKKKEGLILPREHGSWFLLFVPFFSGAFLSQPAIWKIVILSGSVLFAFLSMTPAMLWAKARNSVLKGRYIKWFLIYGGISSIFGVWLLPSYPLLLAIAAIGLVASSLNLLFIKMKAERHIVNDFIGVVSLNIMFLASYYIGFDRMDRTAFHELIYFLIFFLGSTFHVKSLIREKTNRTMKVYSIVYAAFILILFVTIRAPILIQIGQVIALLRVLLIRQRSNLKVLTIGIIEIINGMVFGILFTLSFQQ